MRNGVSLEEIALQTRVSVDVWDALERNDFSRWPSGIYARAYVRAYAGAIGVDPDETVNDFCRGFPQGDRRAEQVVRGTAEIVGHQLTWQDDLPPAITGDRRASAPGSGRLPLQVLRSIRVVAAVIDLCAIGLVSASIATVLPFGMWPTLAAVAVVYQGLSLTFIGSTPVVWAIDAYVNTHPESLKRETLVFRKLDRPHSDQRARAERRNTSSATSTLPSKS
jgi:hypothetical protein